MFHDVTGGRSAAVEAVQWERGVLHGVFGPTDAAGLDQHVILPGERHRAERDHQEQVGRVRLHTLAVKDVTLLRSGAREQAGSDTAALGVRQRGHQGSGMGSLGFRRGVTMVRHRIIRG